MPDGGTRHVRLAGEADVAGFRNAARRLLAEGVLPSQVSWQTAPGDATDLFAPAADDESPPPPGAVSIEPSARITVPAFFVPLCERAALHADPKRFGLLYRLLWRLVHEPGLRGDPLDPDRVDAEALARVVRREMHKMTAFVRFRPIAGGPELAASAAPDNAAARNAADPPDLFGAPDGDPPAAPPTGSPAALAESGWHVAWFEPAHHVVEATAPFFARRFAQMRWAILTPERCVHWDGDTLAFGPGARRDEAPPADAGEQLWLTYYAHIFNPARLKLAAMKKEMPRRYWPNLPEAALIRPLSENAGAKTEGMVERGGGEIARRLPRAAAALRIGPAPDRGTAAPDSLASLRDATQRCRECPIGALATQSVSGEGPERARLVLVGEQPGDQEDLQGRPFVGPAGQLLDKALAQLGWPRQALFLTNAVRHFKYELRGSRRIHKTPAQREVAACLHWLETELDLVKPEAAIALGATAARALLGRAVGVTSERGRWLARADGLPVLITLHPSALLRMEPSERGAAFERWLDDLRQATPYVEGGVADGAR